MQRVQKLVVRVSPHHGVERVLPNSAEEKLCLSLLLAEVRSGTCQRWATMVSTRKAIKHNVSIMATEDSWTFFDHALPVIATCLAIFMTASMGLAR